MWTDRSVDEQIYDHRPRENGGINHVGLIHSQTPSHSVILNGNGTNGNGHPRTPIYGTTVGSLSSNHINHIDGPDLTGIPSPSRLQMHGDQHSSSLPPPPPIESNYASVSEHPTLQMDGGAIYGMVNHNQLSHDGSTYGSIHYGRIEGSGQNPNASDLMNSVGMAVGIGKGFTGVTS